jgi:integrase
MKSIKVPTPRKLPSGNWFIQLSVNGERISVTEPTEKACIARAMAIKQDLLEPADRSKKPTLSVSIDRYIDDRQNILSPSTIVGYRVIQRNRFKAAMERPVNAYDENGWQRLVNQEAKIVSAKTLQNAWFFVSSVIYEQTGHRYNVRLPQIVSSERPFLDPDQIHVFLKAVQGEAFEIPALLALCSLRRSELLALTWDKVDLQHGFINVCGSVVSNGHEMVYKKENKNRSSNRLVPIMIPQLRSALEAAERTSQRVVTISPSAILRGINRVCNENNLPKVGIHGLRHSFASLAYHLNMPEKIAMRIGGWCDDDTMRKIYTHVAEKDVITYGNAMASYYSKFTNEITNKEHETL